MSVGQRRTKSCCRLEHTLTDQPQGEVLQVFYETRAEHDELKEWNCILFEMNFNNFGPSNFYNVVLNCYMLYFFSYIKYFLHYNSQIFDWKLSTKRSLMVSTKKHKITFTVPWNFTALWNDFHNPAKPSLANTWLHSFNDFKIKSFYFFLSLLELWTSVYCIVALFMFMLLKDN